MRAALLLSLLATLPACVAGGSIREEAEPYVDDAFASRYALRQYLQASGAQVTSAFNLDHLQLNDVQQAYGYEFANGGECVVFVYTTANEAVQLGPKNAGDYYVRTMPNGGFGTIRRSFRPTIPFGPSVAVCRGEDARVRNALLGLRDYGEENGIGVPAGA